MKRDRLSLPVLKQLSIAYLASLDRIDQIIIRTISNNMLSSKIQLDSLLTSAFDEISPTSKSLTNPGNRQHLSELH